MSERIMNMNMLQDFISYKFGKQQILVSEIEGGIVRLIPIKNQTLNCPLYGLLEEYTDYTLDSFLKRKHADKELDL
jgi:hypothetical protein